MREDFNPPSSPPLKLKDIKAFRQDDLATCTDQLLRTIERLESEIKVLQATGLVAHQGVG